MSDSLSSYKLSNENDMNAYIGRRGAFLKKLVETLSSDDRFASAWLAGSFGRGEQDALSDIDITLVVSDEFREELCARPWLASAKTTPERYELFSSFGQPAIIHENNRNAPEGGAFTFVAYALSAIMVDWILRPLSTARRPLETLLLWDKVGIPLQPAPEPESLEQRLSKASERIAFFWMMVAVTIKYIYRGDALFVNTWLEELRQLLLEVENRIKGQALEYEGGSYTILAVTPEDQIKAIRQLCERMEKLMPEVEQMGGYVAGLSRPTIELLIRIAEEKYR